MGFEGEVWRGASRGDRAHFASRGLIQRLREKSINVMVYKPDTDKRSRVIAQGDLFEGASVRFSPTGHLARAA
jgi:hypothetical protein